METTIGILMGLGVLAVALVKAGKARAMNRTPPGPTTAAAPTYLEAAARTAALKRAIKPSLLMGIGKVESNANPKVGTTTLDPKGTAAGAWQMIKGTAEWLGYDYDAILAGDVVEQAESAAELYRRNRDSVGEGDRGAIMAHWLGAGGARSVLRGETIGAGVHGQISLADGDAYVAKVIRASSEYTWLDA